MRLLSCCWPCIQYTMDFVIRTIFEQCATSSRIPYLQRCPASHHTPFDLLLSLSCSLLAHTLHPRALLYMPRTFLISLCLRRMICMGLMETLPWSSLKQQKAIESTRQRIECAGAVPLTKQHHCHNKPATNHSYNSKLIYHLISPR